MADVQEDKLVTTKMRPETHQNMKLLAALTGESFLDLFDRLAHEDLARVIDQKTEGGKRSMAEVLLTPAKRERKVKA